MAPEESKDILFRHILRVSFRALLCLVGLEKSKPLLQEIFANYVLMPVIDLLSDPDYFNQNMIWLVSTATAMPLFSSGSLPRASCFSPQCKNNSYTFEFLTLALRTSTHEEELKQMLDPIDSELARLTGRDIGGEDGEK